MKEDATFQAIFHEHADALLVVSYAYVKDWAAAEDIVQDVFLTYWQRSEQFCQESSLKTYLTRMCINASKDYLKSWRYKTHSLTNHFFNSKRQRQRVHLQHERSVIGEAVLALPLKYREPVFLYFYEEYTYRDISELLEIPESTVRSRIQKAKEILKETLPNEQWEVLMDEA